MRFEEDLRAPLLVEPGAGGLHLKHGMDLVFACAVPILLVAPFSMIAAGVVRTVVDTRLGRTTPPTPP